MNRKLLSRKLGKLIRRETGIPLPIAMRMGKLFARARDWEIESKENLKPYVSAILSNCDCCGSIGMKIVGKKGELPYTKVYPIAQ